MSGGSIAALFAQTLLIETAYASPLPMLWHYWFSWERVLTLSALGGIALVLGRLLGMIWNAQRAIQQSWPWWVFGIAMGVGLIILVGYFEKNRSKFLGMYQSLKEWQV